MSIQRDKFASYKLLARALRQKGYKIEIDEAYRPTVVTYTSPKGIQWKTRAAHITYPFNTKKAELISLHKQSGYKLAQSIGFPVPYTRLVTDMITDEELLRMLNKYGKLIVKPTNLSLSKGVTVDIDSLSVLKRALEYAQSFSRAILIQQQVFGEEVRLTVLEGKVTAALLRRTARVIGNGHSTIAELITLENEARRALYLDRITYPQLDETLVKPSLLMSTSIPRVGEIVELNRSTMVKGGCSVYNILPQVDRSYIDFVERLVAKLDAGFVVVDIFCASYTEPAAIGNYWFIEFNTAPVLKLYYACRDGKQFNIVEGLAGAIDRWLHTDR